MFDALRSSSMQTSVDEHIENVSPPPHVAEPLRKTLKALKAFPRKSVALCAEC